MFDAFFFWLGEELAEVGSSLFDLKKRVSVIYLISAFIFVLVVFWWRYGRAGLRRSSAYFSWRVWWHASARTDYGLWLANRLLLTLVIPKALTQTVWISGLFFFWQEQGVSSLMLGWSDAVVIALFTLCYFLMDDFSRFFVHWCLHKVPFLWAFHQVHHSAKVLTPFTVFRTHPIEGFLFLLRSLFVQGGVISLFLVLFPHQVSLLQVFGVLITTFLFNLLGANLRHSNVAISYGKRIEKWLISPAQHQIHHSNTEQHYDRNFGVILAIWDRCFATLHFGHDDQKLNYGTGRAIDHAGVCGQWLIPIKEASNLLRHSIKRLFAKPLNKNTFR